MIFSSFSGAKNLFCVDLLRKQILEKQNIFRFKNDMVLLKKTIGINTFSVNR